MKGFLLRVVSVAGIAAAALCALSDPTPLGAQEITVTPAKIALAAGGDPVEITVEGRRVSELTSVVVVDDQGPVRDVRATLGRSGRGARTVRLIAAAGARPGRRYGLRVTAGRRAIDLEAAIEIVAPRSLVGLSIEGPSTVDEETSSRYRARAVFSDRSSELASEANWSVDPGVAAISGAGVLEAGTVDADTPVTITAGYETGGVAREATLEVTIRDAPFQPVTLTTNVVRVTGILFRPVEITTETIRVTGIRFRPVEITTATIRVTGVRE